MKIEPAYKDIPPEFMQRLGALAISWALIDKLISHMFIGMIDGNDGSMYVITENVTSKTISEWIGTLVDSHGCSQPEYAEHIKEVFKNIEIPRATRNALIHGLWSATHAEPGSVIVQTVRLERAEIVKGEVVTLADLDAYIDEAQEIAAQLHEVMTTLGFPITDEIRERRR